MAKIRRSLGLLLLSISIASAGCGGNSSGNGGNNAGTGDANPPYPQVNPNGEIRGEGNFATLIKKFQIGTPKSAPWAGYWFPYSQGGISDAASKYDAATGGSAASWEMSNHGPDVPGLLSWFGHCNGWSAAAVLYQEPRAAATAGGVTFTVSDQKAILSELAMEVNADFFGSRNNDNDVNSLSFQDVFPDTFFLALTNFVGNGIGADFDRYTGDQVWNQAIAGYKIAPVQPSDYLGLSPSAPNVYRINVTTQVWWVSDEVPSGILTEPFQFTDGGSYESRVLRFELWLDGPVVFDSAGGIQKSGNVIVTRQGNTAMGGTWRNSNLDIFNSHPDYIWVPHSISPSSGFSNPRINQGWVEASFGHRNT